MSPYRILTQFRVERPECACHFAAPDNEYNLPLTPSGTYQFFRWAYTQRELLSRAEAEASCKSLIARFGKEVAQGDVFAWDA